MKSVQTRSFLWSVFSRIRTEYGPEETPYLDTFHAVVLNSINFFDSLKVILIKAFLMNDVSKIGYSRHF